MLVFLSKSNELSIKDIRNQLSGSGFKTKTMAGLAKIDNLMCDKMVEFVNSEYIDLISNDSKDMAGRVRTSEDMFVQVK